MTTREALRGLARTRAKLIDAAMLVVADGKGTGMPGWRMLVAAIDEAQAADKAWNERERLEADAELIATALGAWGSDLLLPAYRRGKAVAVCNAIDTHLFGAPASDATPDEAPDDDPTNCLKCGAKKRGGQRYVCDDCLGDTEAWGPLADAWERGHGRAAFVQEVTIAEVQSEPNPGPQPEGSQQACPTCGGSGETQDASEVAPDDFQGPLPETTCAKCEGRRVIQAPGCLAPKMTKCPDCRGRGRQFGQPPPSAPCAECGGPGIVQLLGRTVDCSACGGTGKSTGGRP